MADSSGQFRELLLTWGMNIGALPTRPTTFYISFHTSDPGETGAGETTIFATRTAQAAWVADQADDGNVKNSGVGTTPLASGTANPTLITHFGVWDSDTPLAGQFYFGGELASFPPGTNVLDNEKLTWADQQLIAEIV